jgi:hypothetical protein
MRRALVALTALGIAAILVSGAPAKGGCTRAQANAAVRGSTLPAGVKDLTRQRFAGVDRIVCADLTRDGRADMAVTLASGGTAGDIAWAAFARTPSGWRLVASNPDTYKVGLSLLGGELVETTPIYRRNDPNCCPTGGFAHRRFHWNGRALVVVRRWHDRRARP